MNQWLRGLAAVVMGLVMTFVVTFGIEWINTLIHPFPPGPDYRDPAVMKAAIAALPASALVVKLVGWLVSGIASTWLATRIARGDHRPGWILGVLLVAAAVGNMMAIPHPVWFWGTALLLYPAVIMVGARLGSRAVTPAG